MRYIKVVFCYTRLRLLICNNREDVCVVIRIISKGVMRGGLMSQCYIPFSYFFPFMVIINRARELLHLNVEKEYCLRIERNCSHFTNKRKKKQITFLANSFVRLFMMPFTYITIQRKHVICFGWICIFSVEKHYLINLDKIHIMVVNRKLISSLFDKLFYSFIKKYLTFQKRQAIALFSR